MSRRYISNMAAMLVSFMLMVFSASALAETVDGRWHIGIGDPTIFGWITVVVYLVATMLCFQKHQHMKRNTGVPQFWLYLAIFLLFLAVNKQLDLQTWLTEMVRGNAMAFGWYKQRRLVQAVFIVTLGVGMLMSMFVLRVFLAKSWRLYKLAWLGGLLLCTFILMRAASFHHFDIFINTHLLGLRVNVILEIGALIIISIAALKREKAFNDDLTPQPLVDESVQLKDYVELVAENDAVYCPKCDALASSKAVHGRLFKCQGCNHKYTAYIAAH